MLILVIVVLLLLLLKYCWWLPNKSFRHPRIMMYHMIADQLSGSKKSGLRVSPKMFEKQLKWFSENQWKFIKMSQLKDFLNEEKVVAITFDDGYEDNYTEAMPLLKKYNATATLYLVIDRHENDWSAKKKRNHNKGDLLKETKLSDNQVQQMVDSGIFELGGHTITHPYLPNTSVSEKRNEILSCKNLLEDKFNTHVASFAYPFGVYDSEDIDILETSNFSSAVTTNEGVAQTKSIFELNRIKASGKDNFFEFKIRVLKGFRGFI